MGAVVLGLSAYAGYRTYDAYAKVSESDLLLANAEALAIANEGGDMSHCSGPSIYAEVGTTSGTKVVREHVPGGHSDRITKYRVERCYAKGNGYLSGQNYIYNAYPLSTTYGACEPDKHNSLYD